LFSEYKYAASLGLVSRLLGVLLRFVSLPLTVTLLSQEKLGLWQIVISLLAWLGLSDMGMPSALQNRLIQALASGSNARAQAVVSYVLRLLLTVGVITGALGVLLAGK
jgi:O-antigen/teichoic acid export membrane protein